MVALAEQAVKLGVVLAVPTPCNFAPPSSELVPWLKKLTATAHKAFAHSPSAFLILQASASK